MGSRHMLGCSVSPSMIRDFFPAIRPRPWKPLWTKKKVHHSNGGPTTWHFPDTCHQSAGEHYSRQKKKNLEMLWSQEYHTSIFQTSVCVVHKLTLPLCLLSTAFCLRVHEWDKATSKQFHISSGKIKIRMKFKTEGLLTGASFHVHAVVLLLTKLSADKHSWDFIRSWLSWTLVVDKLDGWKQIGVSECFPVKWTGQEVTNVMKIKLEISKLSWINTKVILLQPFFTSKFSSLPNSKSVRDMGGGGGGTI